MGRVRCISFLSLGGVEHVKLVFESFFLSNSNQPRVLAKKLRGAIGSATGSVSGGTLFEPHSSRESHVLWCYYFISSRDRNFQLMCNYFSFFFLYLTGSASLALFLTLSSSKFDDDGWSGKLFGTGTGWIQDSRTSCGKWNRRRKEKLQPAVLS